MTQQPETAPSPKRLKLESDEESSTAPTSDEHGNSSEGASLPQATSNTHSLSSSVSEPECAQKFILTDFLPENVAKPYLKDSDGLQKKLIGCLENTLAMERKPFANDLEEINLTLPEKYSSSLENNTPLFCKLVQTSTAMLAKKGEKRVKKVVFPSLDVQKLPGLLSELEVYQDIQLEVIEVPFTFTNKEVIHTHLLDVIDAIHAGFRSGTETFLCGTSETEADLKLSKKNLQKTLQSAKLLEGHSGRLRVRGQLKKKKVSKPKKPEPKSKKKEAMKDKGAKPSEEAPNKKDQVLLTSDSMILPLEVRDRITAYDYWDLKVIHKSCGYTGEGTVIAIIDTGVELKHTAFHPCSDKIVATHNFAEQNMLDCTTDQNGHGTSCAGIACGKEFTAYQNPENEGSKPFQVQPGVAPDAKLVVCKVTRGSDGTVLPGAVEEALKFIKNNHTGVCDPKHRVDVVSISFGSQAYSGPITRAITDLISVGVIVVCAACNEGHKFHTPICYPARLGHVLCIGSHGAHGKASIFSPVGQELDFLAPGEDIVAPGRLEYHGEAMSGKGTSYATPAVAGLICLILECLHKNFPKKADMYHNHWAMKELLREMSTNSGTHSNDRGFGALAPIRFFRQPGRFVESIEMDIL